MNKLVKTTALVAATAAALSACAFVDTDNSGGDRIASIKSRNSVSWLNVATNFVTGSGYDLKNFGGAIAPAKVSDRGSSWGLAIFPQQDAATGREVTGAYITSYGTGNSQIYSFDCDNYSYYFRGEWIEAQPGEPRATAVNAVCSLK